MELSQFAKFSIQTTSVPDEFTTSSRIYELVNAPLSSYNFERELHLIGRYEDLKKRQESPPPYEMSSSASNGRNGRNGNGNGSDRASPEMSDHDQKTQEMQKETGQDLAVCQFYLESTNWNVREAVSLFQSMS